MSLTAADVAEIMRLVEQSRFDELRLEVDGVKVTLRRGRGPVHASAHATNPSGLADAAATDASRPEFPTPHAGAAAGATGPVDANLREIAAPMLGIFYRAPKPGAAPFVEVGSAVDEETVVGIIEVMKLMNTVRAGVAGTITEILPSDEALVEHGEVLMRVRTDGGAHG